VSFLSNCCLRPFQLLARRDTETVSSHMMALERLQQYCETA
jgi:hypothetical protein